MNDQDCSYMRKRGQTLLIVEGNHEKNKLFQLIFRSFPELSICMDDVWIYGTNIYVLYDEIVKAYGESWREDDIDLPLLISTQKDGPKRYKDDFTNIFLVFDYERHDPNFSEQKIHGLQAYFADAYDNSTLDYKEKYNVLDDRVILDKQNKESRDKEDGYIWVLNTCIMLVAEYNFRLLTE